MVPSELQLSEKLLQLSELFPNIPLIHLSHILKVANQDFDQAVEQSLNYDLIKDDIDSITKQSIETHPSVKTSNSQNWIVLDGVKQKEDSILKKNEKKKRKGSKNIQTELTELQRQNAKQTDGSQKDLTKLSHTSIPNDIAISGQSIQETLDSIKVKNLVEKFEMQDTVLELLEIDEKHRELVEWYLDRNDYNKLRTIYDVMLNFDPQLPPDKQIMHTSTTKSFQDLMNSGDSNSRQSPVLMSELIRNNMKDMHVSESDNKCWNELQHLIEGNPELLLPRKFYMLAMNWFNKDIYKVLNLAIVLNDYFEIKPSLKSMQNNENLKLGDIRFSDRTTSNSYDIKSPDCFEFERNDNKHKIEFGYNEDTNDFSSNGSSSITLNSLESRARNLKSVRNTTTDKFLKSHYSNCISETKKDIRTYHHTTQLTELKKKIEQAKMSFSIDLHSLSVQNAINALKIVLHYWWDTEMHFRNIENTKLELSNVVHVENFKIVTGRGLHSSGGIPKIKRATIRFLEDNGYKFNENVASVEVYGKRKTK